MTRTPLSRSKAKGQLVADVLNSQQAETGATWRINEKILSTCRGRMHVVSPRAQLVLFAPKKTDRHMDGHKQRIISGISLELPTLGVGVNSYY